MSGWLFCRAVCLLVPNARCHMQGAALLQARFLRLVSRSLFGVRARLVQSRPCRWARRWCFRHSGFSSGIFVCRCSLELMEEKLLRPFFIVRCDTLHHGDLQYCNGPVRGVDDPIKHCGTHWPPRVAQPLSTCEQMQEHCVLVGRSRRVLICTHSLRCFWSKLVLMLWIGRHRHTELAPSPGLSLSVGWPL